MKIEDSIGSAVATCLATILLALIVRLLRGDPKSRLRLLRPAYRESVLELRLSPVDLAATADGPRQ